MDEHTTSTLTPTPRPRRRRRKKTSAFWVGLGIFAAMLAIFWVFVIGYVHRCLVTYEASQPERVAEQVALDLQKGKVDVQFTASRFESGQDCQAAYTALLAGQTLEVRKSPASYDALAPVYDLYAGDGQVATVSLKETGSQDLMFILTLQEWEVTGVEPVMGVYGPYTITVPDTCKVYCNGRELDQREETARKSVSDFQYAAKYVSVPGLVEYQLKGLISQPDIQVLDAAGQPVGDLPWEGNTLMLDRFPTSEMPQDLRAYVLKNAKDYTNFFSGDLAGSGASTKPIRHMFPADSDYLTLAENYRLHDMWMYSNHDAPTFSDEKVTNYTRYSDDFFSCDISFDKKMILRRTGEARHDLTNSRFYYVNLDGSWLIADMQQILD